MGAEVERVMPEVTDQSGGHADARKYVLLLKAFWRNLIGETAERRSMEGFS